MKYGSGFIWKLGINFAVCTRRLTKLMKQSVIIGAQLLWGGRYGCNNGRYGCTIVMSYIEINKAVSQWLLTFNLCVSVTWLLTCAFHIPCTHTPEIIDMHRGVCDKRVTSVHMLVNLKYLRTLEIACSAPSLHLNHCQQNVSWKMWNKLQRFLNKNRIIFNCGNKGIRI